MKECCKETKESTLQAVREKVRLDDAFNKDALEDADYWIGRREALDDLLQSLEDIK